MAQQGQHRQQQLQQQGPLSPMRAVVATAQSLLAQISPRSHLGWAWFGARQQQQQRQPQSSASIVEQQLRVPQQLLEDEQQ
jgi:hypothetical protein